MSTIEAAAQPLVGTWKIDTTHSSLGFAVRHMVVSTFRGEIADFEAALVAGDEGISLAGSGRVASITTRDEALTAHLIAPDFFDADRDPEIRLAAESAELDGSEVTIRSQLTIKGSTRPIVLQGTVAGPVDDPSAAPASASSSRRRSTAGSSASTGTSRSRPAAWPSVTT